MSNEWNEVTDPKVLFSLDPKEWEIQRLREHGDDADGWYVWNGNDWRYGQEFRARPRQKMKKVKSLCWRNVFDGDLIWRDESVGAPTEAWRRFPKGDIEDEVL